MLKKKTAEPWLRRHSIFVSSKDVILVANPASGYHLIKKCRIKARNTNSLATGKIIGNRSVCVALRNWG